MRISGFLRIFADFNFLSQFFFVKNLYFFLLFLGFSAKISTKNLVPIFENSQGQCPRKDCRIFPVLSGFIRILISCPNFFLKKDKFFIFIFCKKFIFFSFILGFSAKFRFKKSGPNFRKFPRSMSQNPHFLSTIGYTRWFEWTPFIHSFFRGHCNPVANREVHLSFHCFSFFRRWNSCISNTVNGFDLIITFGKTLVLLMITWRFLC